MNSTAISQIVVRIVGSLALVLGILFWTGNAQSLILFHILLGCLLTLALFALVYQAFRAGVSRWLVIVAAVWAIGLPIWGLAQSRIFSEAYLWLSQVLHLLCSIGAMGLAEILGAQIRKKLHDTQSWYWRPKFACR